ncbi:MAG: membrane dipeptidase [Deltaproteobacteria bacterium]|nr:membrane dipeptidase [Deltaproteobacteria bacterium]
MGRQPPVVSDEALAVHRASIVVDLHADTPSLLRLGYDIGKRHTPPLPRAALGVHVDLPRMREGGQCGQMFGLVSLPLRKGPAEVIHRQITLVESAARSHPGELRVVRTAEEVEDAWRAGVRAALLSIEGAHALEGRLENVEEFARRGVRSLGLLHFSANAAGSPAHGRGANPEQALTGFGKDLVTELDRLRILVDLAHINRKGFLEAALLTKKPPIVSHTGVSGVHPHWRNIDDEQIRAVAAKGGCIGIIFAPRFLGRAGALGVVEHLLHVLRVGGEDTPALGSDFDGLVTPPHDLRDPRYLPGLTEALLRRGLEPRIVTKILGGNFLRVLREVGP